MKLLSTIGIIGIIASTQPIHPNCHEKSFKKKKLMGSLPINRISKYINLRMSINMSYWLMGLPYMDEIIGKL